MAEQTLNEWCAWLRTDLAYRAPELWPDVIDRWLRSTEQRFGERVDTETATAAREFVEAVDQARALNVPPMLGPVLIPFQRLRAATGVGPFLGDEPAPTTCSPPHATDRLCLDCATDEQVLASVPPFPGAP